MRLNEKVIAIVGAGQTAGETIGNGRAAAIRFAQEGARLILVDRDVNSAEETREMLREEGLDGSVLQADINRESDCAAIVTAATELYGQLDILHYNVGRSEGDGASGGGLDGLDGLAGEPLVHDFLAARVRVPRLQQVRPACLLQAAAVVQAP